MRPAKAWYWSARDAWFTDVGGKRVRLADGKENKKEAEHALRRLLVDQHGEVPSSSKMTFPELCDLFLDQCQRHSTTACYQIHRYYLQSFSDFVGPQLQVQIKPFHVTKWLDQHPTWKGSRHHAIAAVQRVYNWAISQGLLLHNPVKGIRKTGSQPRTRIVSPNERRSIRENVRDQSFRDFLQALEETGCRPSEVARVEADQVLIGQGIWLLARHKTVNKTGRPRMVYLTPAMLELSRRLMEKYPSGPLFRNRKGKPYTKNAIRCRFRRLRHSLGLKGIVSYSYRHTYATEALVKGVGVAQVSELLGHTSTDMLMRHYGHLAQQVDHMREAANKAVSA